MSDLYKRMKARGINMSWYERGKRGRSTDAIALDDDVCSLNSIYLLTQKGELWTIHHSGSKHLKVRESTKEVPKDVYLCLHCRTQWNDMPSNHPDVPPTSINRRTDK